MHKVAVIGLAGVGRGHLGTLKRLDNVEVVAVCDKLEERARAVAEEFDIPRYVLDYRDLFDLDFEVLMSFTGSYARREHVVLAAEQGKAIFTEKPLAANEADGRAIWEAVKAAGVPYQIGYQLRRTVYGQQIRRVLDAGVLGEIGSLYSHRWMPANHGMPDAQGNIPWYGQQELSGGVTVDFATHDLDLLLWYGGPVREVYGRVQRIRWEHADDHVWAVLNFASGAVGNLGDSFTHTFGGAVLGLTGSAGSLTCDYGGPIRVKLWGEDTERDPAEFGPVQEGLEANQFYQFFQCLEEGREPTPNVDDGWAALEVALAIQRSSATGQPVRLTWMRKRADF